MDRIAEPTLVIDQPAKFVEIATGAVLDPRAPQINQPLGCGRRSKPGQPLADDERDGVLNRRIGTLADILEFAPMEPVVEHGRQVAGDPDHALGADRLNPSLLDRFKHRARLLAAGHESAVDRRTVARHAQRQRVRMTTNDCRLTARELARRLRQPGLSG